MPDRSSILATLFELSLLVGGLILLWWFVLRPAARRQPAPAALARWDAPLDEFFLFPCLILIGVAGTSLATGLVLRSDVFSHDAKIALASAAFQVGALAGIAIFRKFFDHHRAAPVGRPAPHFLVAGGVTFVIAMPIVAGVAFAWQSLLKLGGFSLESQELIRIFSESDSRAFLAAMTVLACVGAPMAEELIFRGGIFRYARTRLPRWAALLAPAVLFGALHGYLSSFAPLVALGIIFSLAYERTGDIKTTMVAHALFNLNSIVLIFAGLST